MLECILGTITAIFGAFGISFVVEKIPIKINPLSIVKNFLVGDIVTELKIIKEHVNENEADRIREAILSYRKSMENGIPLTEHEYEYILKIYDKYDKVLHQNSFVKEVVNDIKRMYKEQCKL